MHFPLQLVIAKSRAGYSVLFPVDKPLEVKTMLRFMAQNIHCITMRFLISVPLFQALELDGSIIKTNKLHNVIYFIMFGGGGRGGLRVERKHLINNFHASFVSKIKCIRVFESNGSITSICHKVQQQISFHGSALLTHC